ncbi:MAG TPA: thymidine phosphorylase [Ktedonobacterales bacterium]|nr:thymidine phosphorylase [Ktedonobacterales bacterium]
MNAVELIRRKRDRGALDAGEIDWLVQAYTDGDVPDYQMAAFMMAVVWRGMNRRETVALTLAMLRSGLQLRAREAIAPVADKHSTGGVGDKVTLAVAPLLAACGLPVAKMTGRGLGHTGGTVDKLESIAGLRTALGRDEFLALVKRHGLALSAQSSELAPADGKMYALRDVTATIDSIPLIAASIMSKKLAVGPSHLLLDVKVGSGAFMKTEPEARRLAETMVRIGEDAGVRTVALLSAMEQPLGRAVGNALEVAEAVDILRGKGPADVTEICLHETATLLAMAGLAADEAEGHARAERAIRDGAGWAKLAEVVAAQGGDAAQIEDTSLLPHAPYREVLPASRSGYVTHIDAERVGIASVHLGAGRLKKSDPIDYAVGLVLLAKVGDRLKAGAPLVEVHARGAQQVAAIRDELLGAYAWGDKAPTLGPLLVGSVSRESLARRRPERATTSVRARQ